MDIEIYKNYIYTLTEKLYLDPRFVDIVPFYGVVTEEIIENSLFLFVEDYTIVNDTDTELNYPETVTLADEIVAFNYLWCGAGSTYESERHNIIMHTFLENITIFIKGYVVKQIPISMFKK